MDEKSAGQVVSGGLDRRRLLRAGAVVGTVAWATPVIQTISSPAFAAGSPLCETRVQVDDCTLTYLPTVDCCECVEDHPELSQADALALCVGEGRCVEDLVICGEEDEDNPPPEGDEGDEDGDEDVADDQESVVPTVIPAGA